MFFSLVLRNSGNNEELEEFVETSLLKKTVYLLKDIGDEFCIKD